MAASALSSTISVVRQAAPQRNHTAWAQHLPGPVIHAGLQAGPPVIHRQCLARALAGHRCGYGNTWSITHHDAGGVYPIVRLRPANVAKTAASMPDPISSQNGALQPPVAS